MKLGLSFQTTRERALWALLRARQPSLASHDLRAERALAAGISPLDLLREELEPGAYEACLETWRQSPPAEVSWGPFQVYGEAGRGQHGIVYWARRGEERLALKVLAPGAAEARFRREVALLERLVHPGIVPLAASGCEDGVPFLATRAISGGDLGQRGRLRPREALRVSEDLAAALAFAHAQGVVHRDLKPQNVLFEDQRPLLIDFGLAKSQDDEVLTQTSACLGSLGFMAPEQLGRAHAAGPSADVWALGALLHFMLCGAPPFAARTVGAHVLAAQAGFNGLPPGPWAPETRAALEGALSLALAPKASERVDLTTLRSVLLALPVERA